MTTLVTIHGFLGTPKDWDFLSLSFPKIELHHLDLFNETVYSPEEGLWSAGKTTNKLAQAIPNRKILIGYSLGGRIALHALVDDPSVWDGAVIISANPGLHSEEEKKQRLQHDSKWSERFKIDPWESVMKDWNAQAVFSGTGIRRNEEDFSRKSLANGIAGWSLGSQDNLKQSIEELGIPILWMTGANDNKFTSIAKGVQLSHPISKHCVIPDASHRVPWDQQAMVVEELSKFLEMINKRRNHDGNSDRTLERNQNISRY